MKRRFITWFEITLVAAGFGVLAIEKWVAPPDDEKVIARRELSPKLNSIVSMQSRYKRLYEVAVELKQQHGLEVVLSPPLQSDYISSLVFDVRDVRLRSLLNIVAEQESLAITEKSNKIFLSRGRDLKTEVYSLSQLQPENAESAELKQLAFAFSSLAPASEGFEVGLETIAQAQTPGSLAIRTTRRQHQRLRRFLEQSAWHGPSSEDQVLEEPTAISLQRIRKGLETRSSPEIRHKTVLAALEDVSRAHQVNIVPLTSGFASLYDFVNFTACDITLENTLNWLARQYDFHWWIDDEVIYVGATPRPELRAFDMPEMFGDAAADLKKIEAVLFYDLERGKGLKPERLWMSGPATVVSGTITEQRRICARLAALREGLLGAATLAERTAFRIDVDRRGEPLHDRLKARITCSFKNAPLPDVCRALMQQSRVGIVMDRKNARNQWDKDRIHFATVTIEAHDELVQSVIERILRPLEMFAVPFEGALWIRDLPETGTDFREQAEAVWAYPIEALWPGKSEAGSRTRSAMLSAFLAHCFGLGFSVTEFADHLIVVAPNRQQAAIPALVAKFRQSAEAGGSPARVQLNAVHALLSSQRLCDANESSKCSCMYSLGHAFQPDANMAAEAVEDCVEQLFQRSLKHKGQIADDVEVIDGFLFVTTAPELLRDVDALVNFAIRLQERKRSIPEADVPLELEKELDSTELGVRAWALWELKLLGQPGQKVVPNLKRRLLDATSDIDRYLIKQAIRTIENKL